MIEGNNIMFEPTGQFPDDGSLSWLLHNNMGNTITPKLCNSIMERVKIDKVITNIEEAEVINLCSLHPWVIEWD